MRICVNFWQTPKVNPPLPHGQDAQGQQQLGLSPWHGLILLWCGAGGAGAKEDPERSFPSLEFPTRRGQLAGFGICSQEREQPQDGQEEVRLDIKNNFFPKASFSQGSDGVDNFWKDLKSVWMWP